MAAFLLLTVPIVILSLISPILAIPNVTAVRIGAGDCSGYPYTYSTGGRSADEYSFTPDLADDRTINGLATGTTGAGLVVYVANTTAGEIFCCDHGGAVEDGLGFKDLLFSTNATDNKLGYWAQGAQPETYTLEINGVAQNGSYLGLANLTTFAFKRVAAYYSVRLLGPGQSLSTGEFKGFLKAVLPPGAYALPPIPIDPATGPEIQVIPPPTS